MSRELEQLMQRRHLVMSALLGLLVALATLVISLKVFIYSEARDLEQTGQLARNTFIIAGQTTAEVLAYANTLEGDPCAPASLEKLRKKVYEFYILNDVAVFEDNSTTIMCTALLGPLNVPHTITEPSRSNPNYPEREIWNGPKLPFYERSQIHHLSKTDRFAVILDTKLLGQALTGQDWQTYARTRDDGFRHHGFGNEALFQQYQEYQAAWLFPAMIVGRVCITETHILCVLVGRPFVDILRKDIAFILPSALLALSLGSLVFLGTKRLYRHRISPQGRIKRAMRQQDPQSFQCHYQPLVDLETGLVKGCEVLARYQDTYGAISPLEFIPVIEKMGTTWRFTELIMARVIRDFAAMRDIPADFRISINVFPVDLEGKTFERVHQSQTLQALLALGPKIVFEILETGVTDSQNSAQTLDFLTNSGIEIAIDDFGTGFSNLEQLKAIDATYLKIDKSFTDELSVNEDSVVGTFVRHIVSLASEIGVKIIAEGIEKKDQVPLLQLMNVQYGQGYYFSRPVPPALFQDVLTTSYEIRPNADVASPRKAAATA